MGGGEWRGGVRERERDVGYTKPDWYVSFVNVSYSEPEQCSLASVSANEFVDSRQTLKFREPLQTRAADFFLFSG